jgi:hypothetical protein
MEGAVANKTIQRALRLLEGQRRASRAYYLRHRDEIRERSTEYWKANRELINARRRERYEQLHSPPQNAAPSVDGRLQ